MFLNNNKKLASFTGVTNNRLRFFCQTFFLSIFGQNLHLEHVDKLSTWSFVGIFDQNYLKISILSNIALSISIFYKIFDFWQNFRCLTKFLMFDKIFDFWQNVGFVTKISFFNKHFDFLTNISIFIKNIDFRQKFRKKSWPQITGCIFCQTLFLSIFGQNLHLETVDKLSTWSFAYFFGKLRVIKWTTQHIILL